MPQLVATNLTADEFHVMKAQATTTAPSGVPGFAPKDLPSHVSFSHGEYTNRLGLKLATYGFDSSVGERKGVVYLAHGYATFSLFDYILPSAPGMAHDTFRGSVIEGTSACNKFS
jgi:hypothetical protein